ncbi:hypothetical protein MBOT_11030 [Mycobacterium botniense]|uniref:DUF4226 domain-containing protein n=1 Tax=Mycobacterium botniense TaxID=84962 RepID=A0A7I9XV24_9MYCO|nr:hypothetical protein MBOT_11030 [Mycobacterium botniense]
MVASANLDDTSESALMAAWTSLYGASTRGPGAPGEGQPPRAAPVVAALRGDDPAASSDAALDPYLESLLAQDPSVLPGDAPAPLSPAPMPLAPTIPGIPGLGGMAPGSGGVPSVMPGWGAPGGVPGAWTPGDVRAPRDRADELMDLDDPNDEPVPEHPDHNAPDDESGAGTPSQPPAGPTTVTLPNGDTVTAASPQLAAAIKAAAGGTPIPDAFREQGITIPPPGTPVVDPVDPSLLAPGDIGMFTDHHALALGKSKALLNGQIQHISTVTGPGFLGWEHPPATTTAPAKSEAPTPTRPAATTGASG